MVTAHQSHPQGNRKGLRNAQEGVLRSGWGLGKFPLLRLEAGSQCGRPGTDDGGGWLGDTVHMTSWWSGCWRERGGVKFALLTVLRGCLHPESEPRSRSGPVRNTGRLEVVLGRASLLGLWLWPWLWSQVHFNHPQSVFQSRQSISVSFFLRGR